VGAEQSWEEVAGVWGWGVSLVTNAILCFACTEREEAVLLAINAGYGRRTGGRPAQFRRVDQHAGGPKAMECTVAMCAFNHLDEEALLAVFGELKYENPESVQLFLRAQWDWAFKVFMLHPDKGMVCVFAGSGSRGSRVVEELTR